MNIHERPHYSFFRAVLIYTIAVVFLFYVMGLQVSPSVMAFELMQSFRLDAAGLGIIAGVYFYSYAFMQVPAGLMFDRYGARLLLTVAIIICAIGAFFFGNTYSAFWAMIGRLCMGFGSAFAFTGVLVVAALWFKPHRFALLVGLAQLFASLGAMGGAYPIALLLEVTNWRVILVFASYIGVAIAILAFLIVRDHPREKVAADVFHNPKIKESLKRVFSNSQSWWLALYAFAGWGPIILFAGLWGIPFLTVKFMVSNQLAASSMSSVWLGLSFASPLIGWLSDVFKSRTPLMLICGVIGVVCSLLLIYVHILPFWSTYPLLFGMGIASSGQILSFAVVKDINPPTNIATAIGFNNMAVVLGGAVFQPLVGWFLQLNWEGKMMGGTPFYNLYDYTTSLTIIPVCYLVCVVSSAFLIKETHCKPHY